MAKYKSLFRINGKLGDVKFKKGKVAMVGDKFESNGKVHERTDENRREFGGVAKSAGALLRALSKVRKSFMDKRTQIRAAEIMREILNLGTGKRGERLIDLVTHKSKVIGFELSSTDKLETMLMVPVSAAVNADRNEVTVDIPDFSTITDLSAPEFATHLRFKLAIGVASNHALDPNSKKYGSVNDSKESINNIVVSAEIPIGGMVGQTTTLVVQLPNSPVLDADEILIGALGIEFCEFLNGQYYTFETDNAMQIIVAE